MDSDEEIFSTQSKFREVQSSGDDTDTVLNDILYLEGERKMQNFDIKLDIFSDISDDNLLKKSDRVLKEAQSDNIPDIVKSDEKGVNVSQNLFQMLSVKKSLNQDTQETQSKSRWAVNLFNSWLENRQDNYGNRNDIRKI